MKETENLICSGVRLIFISLMNTKSGIFTRGFATRQNTAFDVHSMKQKSILHRKNQISSIYFAHIDTLSKNYNSNDENWLLGKLNHESKTPSF